jgi:hypothetical protein
MQPLTQQTHFWKSIKHMKTFSSNTFISTLSFFVLVLGIEPRDSHMYCLPSALLRWTIRNNQKF